MNRLAQKPVVVSGGTEKIVSVTSNQHQLTGVLHTPTPSVDRQTGIIIVPGAPQYRIGSHRQFLLMARQLAKLGYSVLRIDYPSVGDSVSLTEHLSDTTDDTIVDPQSTSHALIDFSHTLRQLRPQLRHCLALGLCDGATAIAETVGEANHHTLLDGIILLNPWTHAQTQRAKTQLKHYYLNRLLSRAFWKKLATGQIALSTALKEIRQKLSQTQGRQPLTATEGAADSSRTLLTALNAYSGKQLILLSEHDLVARDFIAINKTQPKSHRLAFTIVADADHTFSRATWRNALLDHISHWLESIAEPDPKSPNNRPASCSNA